MTDLFRRDGGEPALLPPIAYDQDNQAFTTPYADEDLTMLGFALAPAQPEFDPATQVVEWQDGAWAVSDIPPPPPFILTPAAIDAERDRRLIAGTTFANHLFQTDQLDRERIDRSRISAIAAIMGGAQKGDLRWHGQPVDFFWIAADNARVAMDAQTMVAFGNAVAAREGLLIIAGNDLKRRLEVGEEIGDIEDDALWPA